MESEPLSVDKWAQVLDQAIALGLEGVGIIGRYEPLQEKGIFQLIEEIRKRGLRVTLFTKGQCILESIAEKLSYWDVTVGISVNSLKAHTHDSLTGKKGSYSIMKRGLEKLLKKGYDKKRHKILIQTVILKNNIEHLSGVWRWAKQNDYTPFFERMTIKGRAHENLFSLNVQPHDLLEFFNKIASIDEHEFNNVWRPQPPWIAESCDRHLSGCHITMDGYVQPCTGVDIPIGNVRDEALLSIISSSKVMQELRDIKTTIKGPCKDCFLHDDCYGCRGQAYQLTGDYLASDPCCWYNFKNCEIECKAKNNCKNYLSEIVQFDVDSYKLI